MMGGERRCLSILGTQNGRISNPAWINRFDSGKLPVADDGDKTRHFRE